jgi:hypothetical protein
MRRGTSGASARSSTTTNATRSATPTTAGPELAFYDRRDDGQQTPGQVTAPGTSSRGRCGRALSLVTSGVTTMIVTATGTFTKNAARHPSAGASVLDTATSLDSN